MREKIKEYIRKWKKQGYPKGIPDEVPDVLMRLNLAPSYKAIALAILKNDTNLVSLGYSPPYSYWYDAIKHVEIQGRQRAKT